MSPSFLKNKVSNTQKSENLVQRQYSFSTGLQKKPQKIISQFGEEITLTQQNVLSYT